jgi:pre-mRNA-splicing factor ATP-dependent RNA helicase DHX38/PRP16
MNSHDHDKWELNRMVTSGTMKMRDNSEVELENMESEQSRVLLLVHDLKPPFLDGRENFTRQTKPV